MDPALLREPPARTGDWLLRPSMFNCTDARASRHIDLLAVVWQAGLIESRGGFGSYLCG